MTNHDHHRDGEQAENTKPNYTLRRIKTLLAVIACTASATLLFTWRTADSQTATILVSVIYILTCLWLTVRFARPRIPILFSLYQKRRHSGACKPFQVRLTASIAVGHATDREHVQVVVPTVKGAFGIQGRHRSDSDASHSAPSTRQGGAHNINKQRKSHDQ